MMKSVHFRTQIEILKGFPALSHTDAILLLGSCFAENIGDRLAKSKFNCVANPYGVLYNPASISAVLREIMSDKVYGSDDIGCSKGIYYSDMHHGVFSDITPERVADKINRQLMAARKQLCAMNRLFITFGTAYAYARVDSDKVVSNCHKLPAGNFRRFKLSVEEIVRDYTALIQEIQAYTASSGISRDLRIIMTVSPIRHLKDGFIANQRSKSTLLLAVEALQERFPEVVHYFPAYEIMTDDLRDYRFYEPDMLHPSDVAIDYIWDCLSTFCFSRETKGVALECEQLHKMLNHRPLFEESEAYTSFLMQLMLKIEHLKEKYPTLDFENEYKLCRTKLK